MFMEQSADIVQFGRLDTDGGSMPFKANSTIS
jgi:hypothetical protein